MQPIGEHCCEDMYFGPFGFRGELGFLNCDDVCICVVNKQFELLEFVFNSAVDLQYDEISLTFTAGWGSWKKRARRDPSKTTRPIHLVKLFTDSSNTSNL